MYTIILTFYGVMGLSSPTSYQVVIPDKAFVTKEDCVLFGKNAVAKKPRATFVCVKG